MDDPTEFRPIELSLARDADVESAQRKWIKENLPEAIVLKHPIRSMLDGEEIEWSPWSVMIDHGEIRTMLIRLPDGKFRVLRFDVYPDEEEMAEP